MMRRRRMLWGGVLAAAGAAAAARVVAPTVTGAARAQVLIVGAGWAGLAAAYALRAESDLDVHLVDRAPVWRALPLSNPWLVGLTGERLPRIDLAGWAQRHGVRFSAGTVTAIDRAARRVDFARGEAAAAAAAASASRPTAPRAEPLPYDALLLAGGAVADHAAWFGNDERATAEARTRFPAGFAADELDPLKQHLHAFAGGTLLMTVPPPPLRCPPAPYERALLVADWLRRRGLRARLVLLDATGGMPRFNRLLATAGGDSVAVEHHRHQRFVQVDPLARRIVTADGTIDFEHAMLLPPMRAPRLLVDAALVDSSDSGDAGPRGASAAPAAGRYAAVDPLTLQTQADKRIWVAGDALGRISPLFGAYPKTAQIAAETGAAAAAQIIAALRGAATPPPSLPASACHVWLGGEPPEQLQLDVSHRLRGDGVVMQQVRQTDNPLPRDEDLAWARALLAQRLGVSPSQPR